MTSAILLSGVTALAVAVLLSFVLVRQTRRSAEYVDVLRTEAAEGRIEADGPRRKPSLR